MAQHIGIPAGFEALGVLEQVADGVPAALLGVRNIAYGMRMAPLLGGGALTREKIVAAQSARFICIADESKRVAVLGTFPLPVEIIPMAAARIIREFAALGGDASLRMRDGQPYVTDNGQHILDVRGLHINDPLAFETEVNQWPGVVTVGVFARQKADVCLLGTANGVQELIFDKNPHPPC